MAKPLRFRAKGCLKLTEYENATEAAYADLLTTLQLAGDILWWRYHAIRVRLANGSFYTPDFLVMQKDGTLECHETKGFWREAAKVRIKVAAEIYPFRFVAIRRIKGSWEFEDF